MVPNAVTFYHREDYHTIHQDFLINMDLFALAMFQNVRDDLLEGDQMECLQIFMH